MENNTEKKKNKSSILDLKKVARRNSILGKQLKPQREKSSFSQTHFWEAI